MPTTPGNIGTKGVTLHDSDEQHFTSTLDGSKRRLDVSAAIVSGSSGSALSPSAPSTGTATTSSTVIVAANSSRTGLIIVNLSSTATIFLSQDGSSAAILNRGDCLFPREHWVMMPGVDFHQREIRAIVSSGTATISIQEFV